MMTIVLLGSAVGSPGVTTTCLALALTWPRSVLVVDCDRNPSQAVLAGWLRAAPVASRGLVDLAQAHREMLPIAPILWSRTVPLTAEDVPDDDSRRGSSQGAGAGRGTDVTAPDTASPDASERRDAAAAPAQGDVVRRFLPGFSRPGAAVLFEPVWPELAEALAGLAGSDVDILIDAGRVGAEGPPASLLAISDVVALTVRSSLRSLAAVRLYVPGLSERVAGLQGPRFGFVVVGPGRPYSDAEIEHEFALPVLADLPWSPDDSAVLSEGGEQPRRFTERPLLRGARAAASALGAAVPRAHQSSQVVPGLQASQLSGAWS